MSDEELLDHAHAISKYCSSADCLDCVFCNPVERGQFYFCMLRETVPCRWELERDK